MVSKASDDLPEPDSPVNTTSLSRGISTSMFLRLCSRAPRMAITRASGRLRLFLSNRSFIGLFWIVQILGKANSGLANLGEPPARGSRQWVSLRNVVRTRPDYQGADRLVETSPLERAKGRQ